MADLIVLPWNDGELLERTLRARAREIAAVITEPVMGNVGCVLPQPGYLETMRRLCDELGIVLIFDEIITGFRLSLNGASGHYGVTPDLSLFGKALGSGFPLAAIVGRARWMAPLEAGEAYHAGTMNGNNACVAAGLATLRVLERDDRAAHRHIVRLGTLLRDGLAGAGARSGLPVRVMGPGPMFHMGFTTLPRITEYRHVQSYDRAAYQEFCRQMLLRGVRLIERGLWYVSTAHSEEDIRVTLDHAEAVLTGMAQSGS